RVYGANLGEGGERVGPGTRHPFVVRNLLVWATHYGIRTQAPPLLMANLRLHETISGTYPPTYANRVYRHVTIQQDASAPFNRGLDDLGVHFGALTVDGLTFQGVRGIPDTIPLTHMSDDNPTGKAVSHFRNIKVDRREAANRRPVVNIGGET